MSMPEPVDPTTIAALSGCFEPVHDERDATDLAVRGEIPADLRGAYLRNGPNPLFTPLGSYTFPLEGDAMVHAVWIDGDGGARYRNRFLWNPPMRFEQEAGHALWAGLMTGWLPGPDLVPAPWANAYKPQPFINVVHHGGRWLAMSEVDPPWEIDAELATVGDAPFTWDGAIAGCSPHTRIDPTTGEMFVIRYDLVAPFLAWGAVGADGVATKPLEAIDLDGPHMVHDFVLTADHVVICVMPVQFDLTAMLTGAGDPLAWDGAQPTRIAVLPRSGTAADVRWFDVEPFWAYHFANAFEDGDQICVDFARFHHFALGPSQGQSGGACRLRIDLRTGATSLTDLDDRICEFPRVDDRLQTLDHRRFTASTKAPGSHHLHAGEFDVLLQVDTHTGDVAEWSSPGKCFGEVAFAPAEGSEPGEGYLVTFQSDVATRAAEWIVLDASDVAAGPIASVELPFRVPNGLHGNWFTADELGT